MPIDALATLQDLLSTFRLVFTRPGFEKFVVFAVGWILTQGPLHCVTEALVATDVAERRHWEAFHRFFSRGTWEPDQLGYWLLQRLRRWRPDGVLRLVLDDTLCPKKGPEIFGLGTHLDAVRSTRKHKVFCFGHCWVVLAVLLRVPFSERTWALPILFRLYRSKAEAEADYQKKTELGRQMVATVVGWTEAEHVPIHLALDQGYANTTVLRELSPRVTVVGALRPNAALWDVPPPSLKGRPRRRGERLPCPTQLAEAPTRPWDELSACLYGTTETVVFKTLIAQWYHVTGSSPLRIVVVHCLRGSIPYRAFFCTDPTWDVRTILESYAGRWAIEVFFRDAKQLFGFADSPALCEHAVRRVAPLVGLLFSLLVVWFAEIFLSPVVQVPTRPWYPHKKGLCFADILRAARRTLAGVDVLAWEALLPSSPCPAANDTRPKDSQLPHAA
jgi:hypothetical protein